MNEARIRIAETMLEKYIRERKKALAELALETLLELAPSHPRRGDYETWVADIDREVAAQAKVEALLARGREALRRGDRSRARRQLAALAKLERDGPAHRALRAEIERARNAGRPSPTVDERRARIEELLTAGRVEAAGREIEALAAQGVAKLTLDFLHRRLDEARARLRQRSELDRLLRRFGELLSAGRWQQARDVARRVGTLRPTTAAELFERVGRREAAHRRREAIDQGVLTLERFIAQNRRAEAEVALQVLRGLELDERQVQLLRQRVERLRA